MASRTAASRLACRRLVVAAGLLDEATQVERLGEHGRAGVPRAASTSAETRGEAACTWPARTWTPRARIVVAQRLGGSPDPSRVDRRFAPQHLRVVAHGERRDLIDGGARREDGRFIGADQQRRERPELGAAAEQAGLAEPRGRVRGIVMACLTRLAPADHPCIGVLVEPRGQPLPYFVRVGEAAAREGRARRGPGRLVPHRVQFVGDRGARGKAVRPSRLATVSAEEAIASATPAARSPRRLRRAGVAWSSCRSVLHRRVARGRCRHEPAPQHPPQPPRGRASSPTGRCSARMRASSCSLEESGSSAPYGCRPVSASCSATQKLNWSVLASTCPP
jgi:hypothetical protein